MYILNYDIWTEAGDGVSSMMKALFHGEIHSLSPGMYSSISSSYKKKLLSHWNKSLNQCLNFNSKKEARWGLILATTKGMTEDFIWSQDKSNRSKDSGALLLEELISHCWPIHLPKPHKTASVNQACSSSHSAFELASIWIQLNLCDYVLVLAGDLVGPFISKGFQSLKVIASEQQQPFDERRDGLLLGDAVGAILFSREKPIQKCVKLLAVANETEGAVTRPSLSGDCLLATLNQLKNKNRSPNPDFILAHGTGTKFNDLAEDRALYGYLNPLSKETIPVTGCKWSLGHTLGASGLVDLIASCEIFKHQKIFNIATLKKVDPKLKLKNYLVGDFLKDGTTDFQRTHFRESIITSLGFGGVHASCWLEWESHEND